MENNSIQNTDPVALIERLDADEIREQLAELARKREALQILLRAASRRNRDKEKAVANDR